eukprot:s2642_g2.t1
MLQLYHEVTGFRHKKSCRTEQTKQTNEATGTAKDLALINDSSPVLGLIDLCMDEYGRVDACRRKTSFFNQTYLCSLSHTIQRPPDRNRRGQIKILSSSLRGHGSWQPSGHRANAGMAWMPSTFTNLSSGSKVKAWGDWMGAWKAEAGQTDVEQDRLSRAQAAFGGETMARMKDINVLILGCRGVGVETAKNLILSNVSNSAIDRGCNFYLTESSTGKPRAAECMAQLKSLNPYCKVESLEAEEAALPSCLAEASVPAVVFLELSSIFRAFRPWHSCSMDY